MKYKVQGALIAVFSIFGGTAFAQSNLPQCGRFPTDAQTYDCACPAGGTARSVWGSGPYTADSDICAAARHAGAIGEGGGAVTAVRAAGLASYTGSSRNGITTRDWGSYGVSIVIVGKVQTTRCDGFDASAAPIVCTCEAGSPAGSVWGMGPFTGDSDICTAARFEGVIGPEGGTVRVVATEGLESYAGGSNNGVTTRSWGSYSDSFVFDWNMQ